MQTGIKLMDWLEASFKDIDHYNQIVGKWNLDFRILSKNNFSAGLKMCTNHRFQFARTSLSGTIEQYGLRPKGYRTLAIPAHNVSPFNWLNKSTDAKQLLIFPKEATLDCISFKQFKIYVISIEENYLFQTLDFLGYKNAKNFFDGSEKYVDISEVFSHEFYKEADMFIDHMYPVNKRGNPSADIINLYFDKILVFILKFLEYKNENKTKTPQRKRDRAIKIVTDLVNSDLEETHTLGQLCNYAGISERTLEYAFTEKFALRPTEYIKAIKLNKIKNELLLSEKSSTKISTLTASYGFWHMGQFAADYKKWFGELPSETLNRKI